MLNLYVLKSGFQYFGEEASKEEEAGIVRQFEKSIIIKNPTQLVPLKNKETGRDGFGFQKFLGSVVLYEQDISDMSGSGEVEDALLKSQHAVFWGKLAMPGLGIQGLVKNPLEGK